MIFYICLEIRFDAIRSFLFNFRNPDCQEELSKWNIKLDNDLVKFEARVVDAEEILYREVNFTVLYYYVSIYFKFF